MSDIAKTAQVSTATVYAYFPSKEALFGAVVDAVSAQIEARLAVDVQPDDDDPIMGLAIAFLRRLNDPEIRALFRIMAMEGPRFPEALSQFDANTRLRAHDAAIALFTRLASVDRFIGEPATASRQLMGMLEHETLMLGVLHGDDTYMARGEREIAEDAVRTLKARFEPATLAR